MMQGPYFVIGDSEFDYEGRRVSVVKCDSLEKAQQIVTHVTANGVNRIWIARAVESYERTTVYKRASLQ